MWNATAIVDDILALFLQSLTWGLLHDPVIILLDICPYELKIYVHIGTYTLILISISFIISKN